MATYTFAYDKIKGNILLSCEGKEKNFLKTIESDPKIINLVTNRDLKNIGIMVAEVEQDFYASRYIVKDNKIFAYGKIELSTTASDEKNPNGVPEIEGDGQSTCVITARVLKPDGKVNKKFSSEIKFCTERGKLNAKNGIVKAKQGIAKVELTSVSETVPPFEIRADAEGCVPATLEMEFY